MRVAGLLVIVVVATFATCIDYSVKIASNSLYCFTSFIAKNAPFHFRVIAEANSNYTLTMSLQNGTIITRREQPAKTKKIDSYSKANFDYRFCVENLYADSDTFHINFHEGIELGDLSYLPKMEDIRYVEQLVQLIGDTHSKLRQLQDASKNTNEYSMEVQKLISFKTIAFGFLSLAVILVVGFLHYSEIKRTLRNRKMI